MVQPLSLSFRPHSPSPALRAERQPKQPSAGGKFARFIKSRSKQLRKMGVQPRCKLLPPIAVDYLCREYGIDISEI